MGVSTLAGDDEVAGLGLWAAVGFLAVLKRVVLAGDRRFGWRVRLDLANCGLGSKHAEWWRGRNGLPMIGAAA